MHPSKFGVKRCVGSVCFLLSIDYWPSLSTHCHLMQNNVHMWPLWPTCHWDVLLKLLDFHSIQFPILNNSPTSASAMIWNRILSPQNTSNKNHQNPETLAKMHARFCLYGTWSTPPCAKAFTVSWRAASVSCGFLWVTMVYRGCGHAPSISSTHHLAQNLRQCKKCLFWIFFGSIWKIENDTKWIKWWISMDFQLNIGPYSFRRAILTLRLHARLWSAVQDPAGGVDLRSVPGIFLINRFVWIRWIANYCIYIVEDTHVCWLDVDVNFIW